MDIIDHIHVDIDSFLVHGPGPSFGLKLMLGPIDSDIDRSSKKKDSHLELYGEVCCRLTKQEMDECPCRKEPLNHQNTTYGQMGPVGKNA